MASMTNQTDIYTKTEVDTIIKAKADDDAYQSTKGIVDSATTGVAALNTAVGNRALQSSLDTTNTAITTNRTALDARATDNLANINTAMTTPNPYPSFSPFVFPVDIIYHSHGGLEHLQMTQIIQSETWLASSLIMRRS